MCSKQQNMTTFPDFLLAELHAIQSVKELKEVNVIIYINMKS